MAEPRLVFPVDAEGRLVEPVWLARAEPVHRQLRPAIGDYAATMARVFEGGARMVLAADGDTVCGLAVWRQFADTANRVKFYIDDLVTDEARRGQGVGHLILDRLTALARAAGAGALVLDSSTQRTRAHAFYFREGFVITSFNFKKLLS